MVMQQQLDNQYERYQRIRAHRIGTRGEKAVRVLGDNSGIVRGGGEAGKLLVAFRWPNLIFVQLLS
jgi:hypothetical protein